MKWTHGIVLLPILWWACNVDVSSTNEAKRDQINNDSASKTEEAIKPALDDTANSPTNSMNDSGAPSENDTDQYFQGGYPELTCNSETPVCGCDGQTYENHCVAARKGLYYHKGACSPDLLAKSAPDRDTPVESGGGSQSSPGFEGSGEPLPEGTCSVNAICTMDYNPVCANGYTYANSCLANAAGAKITSKEACKTICYLNHQRLLPGETAKEAGNTCTCTEEGILDCVITSTPPSEDPLPANDTFCMEVVEPVCGANGKTYSNECYALKAGVAIAYNSECK